MKFKEPHHITATTIYTKINTQILLSQSYIEDQIFLVENRDIWYEAKKKP